MVRSAAEQGHRFFRWKKVRRPVHGSVHISQRALDGGPLRSGLQDRGLVRHRKDVFPAAIPKSGFLARLSTAVLLALRWLVPEIGGSDSEPVSVGLCYDPHRRPKSDRAFQLGNRLGWQVSARDYDRLSECSLERADRSTRPRKLGFRVRTEKPYVAVTSRSPQSQRRHERRRL